MANTLSFIVCLAVLACCIGTTASFSVSSLTPSLGETSGGTPVVVQGTGFSNTTTWRCQFSNAVADSLLPHGVGVYLSANRIVCTAPPCTIPCNVGDVVTVEVFNSVSPPTSDGQTFTYTPPINVSTATPDFGVPGDVITVTGTGFVNSAFLTCKFKDFVSAATYVNDSVLTCAAPTTDYSGLVPVAVSNNQHEFSATTADFTFKGPLEVKAILPSGGQLDGGTTVIVTGENIENGAQCYFGENSTVATFVSYTRVLCTSPFYGSLGSVPLEVANPPTFLNRTSNGHIFQYVEAHRVLSVSPKEGPHSGGSTVTLAGEGFFSSAEARCRVKAVSSGPTVIFDTPAQFVDATQVKCTTPSMDATLASVPLPTGVQFYVSYANNGLSFDEIIGVNLVFKFYRPMKITSIDTHSGPMAGGTLINVIGTDLLVVGANPIRCKFGELEIDATSVLTDTHIICQSPPTLAPGDVFIEVSNNKLDYTTDKQVFRYHAEVRVSAVVPNNGPIGVGTDVTLIGENFFNPTPFDTPKVYWGTEVTNGIYLTSSIILTKAPTNLPVGDVLVDLSFNSGLSFSQARVVYAVQDTHTVTAVSPALVPATGGIQLTVSGTKFMNSPELKCRIGTQVESATWLSEGSCLCAMTAQTPGNYFVEVTNNGADWTADNVTVTLQSPVEIYDIGPITHGPLSGETRLAINGTGFLNTTDAACSFGTKNRGDVVPATYVSNTQVVCITPWNETAGVTTVEYTTNGEDYTSNGQSFTYFADPDVASLNITTGVVSDSTIGVAIMGSNFKNGPDLRVRFGNMAPVVPHFVSSSELAVTVPTSTAVNTVAVDVSNNGVQYSQSRVLFRYDNLPGVSPPTPATGPDSGGSVITITGSGFSNLGTLKCVFDGSTIVDAIYLSTTNVVCTTPPHAPGSVSVHVTNNGVTYGTPTAFEYKTNLAVHSISQGSGPVTGKTFVTITGANIPPLVPDSLRCIFGNRLYSTPATWGSPSHVTCVTPSHPASYPGSVNVHLSMNAGHDYSPVNATAQFIYYDSPNINTPFVPHGTLTGGTVFNIPGTNFAQVPGLKCRVGTFEMTSTWVSSTTVTCVTPPGSGIEMLEVALNGQDWTSNNAQFEYNALESVVSVYPTNGVASGGTIVTVIGTAIRDSLDTKCNFTTPVQAEWLTASKVLCKSPAASAGTTIPLEVASNAIDYTANNVQFQYYADPKIVSITPVSGPDSGGSTTTIDGQNFFAGTSKCKFGNTTVPATYVNSTRVLCTSPEHLSGHVHLSYSNNDGRDYTTDAISYLYQPVVSVTSLERYKGPTAGNTQLRVYGQNFADTGIICRFGSSNVAGQLVSTSTVLCPTPASAASTVEVDVSINNADDFTTSSQSYTFYPNEFVSTIAPENGPESGTTFISVVGGNFVNSKELRCKFGSAPDVTATWVSATLLTCFSPGGNQSSGPQPVEVTSNNMDYTSSAVTFQYKTAQSVASVTPDNGPVTGGSLVTVTGQGFVWGPATKCRFGPFGFVSATFVSTTKVTCLSPGLELGPFPVEVTNNDQDYTANNVLFTYKVPPHVISLTPDSGQYTGGTDITVVGQGFEIGSTWVMFGSSVPLPVTVNSTTLFVVTSPSFSAGTYAVEVSNNAVDFSRDGVLFTYVGTPKVQSLSPKFGPKSGGSKVTVTGVNFRNSADIVCFFGAASVRGYFLDPFNILCNSPATLNTGGLSLEIALSNTTNATVSTDNVQFFYEEGITITDVNPKTGPLSGGTEVTVTGSSFIPTVPVYSITCAFGLDFVPGQLQPDNTTILCVSPKGFTAGAVNVEISNDGQQYTNWAKTFTYENDIAIDTVFPQSASRLNGTTVTLKGANFVNSANLKCKFGSVAVVPATFVSANEVTCVVPSANAETDVVLEVANNNVDYSSSGKPFYFFDDPTVTSLTPTHGPAGTGIVVTGTNFKPHSTLKCRWTASDVLETRATWYSATSLNCITPVSGNATWATQTTPTVLQITNNDHDYTATSLAFTYEPTVVLGSISPARGPVAGGSNVTIVGTGFHTDYAGAPRCLFDIKSVIATVVNTTHIICMTPGELSLKNVTVRYASNAETYSASTLVFEYRQDMTVTAVTPDRSSTAGGTVITVDGTSFQDTATAQCRFGAQVVPVTFISNSRVHCAAPANVAGRITVEVSANGYDWTDSKVAFVYDAIPAIAQMIPVRGRANATTLIEFIGTDFVNSPACKVRFGGSILAPLVFHNKTHAFVESPSYSQLTIVDLEITTNGVDWFPLNRKFEVFSDPQVISVSPSHGPVSGGTQFTITGSNFGTAGVNNITVAIGHHYDIPCSSATTTTVVCTTPHIEPLNSHTGSADGTGTAPVEVSVNSGLDYTKDNVVFDFTANPKATDLSPSYVAAAGGATVTVIGKHFTNNAELRCQLNPGAVTLAAAFVDAQHVACTVPVQAPGVYTLHVANEGQVFTANELYLTMYATETVTAVTPSRALLHGGIDVVVVGTGFIQDHGLKCQFGTATSVATWFNSTHLQCTAPAQSAAGVVQVKVASDGMNFLSTSDSFTYIDVQLSSVSPDVMQEEAPASDVRITGTGYANLAGFTTKVCKWESPYLDEPVTTAVHSITATTLDCAALTNNRLGSVKLSLLLDDLWQTYNPALNVTFEPCPPGYYCINSVPYPCPAGTKCPAPGRNDNYTVCPAGTYQDQAAQADCITCDAGFYCPDDRMIAPIICPAGYICPVGSSSATTLCLPGHYCPQGTGVSTVDPASAVPPFAPGMDARNEWDGTLKTHAAPVPVNFNPYPGFPMKCKAGFYCSGNIEYHPNFKPSGQTQFDGDLTVVTAPRPCFATFACPKGSTTAQGDGACPAGYFCAPGQGVQPCPAGMFAAGEGNSECTPCSAGSYQNETGSPLCKSCPLGHYCPSSSMVTPTKCPAGFVCATPGLSDATQLCPEGHWCPEGVATALTNTTGDNRPLPCRAGTYCTLGVNNSTEYTPEEIAKFRNQTTAEGIAAAGIILSKRPQLCLIGRYCPERTGASGGIECPEGSFCPEGSSVATLAQPGEAAPNTGMGAASKCIPGTYSDQAGSISCTNCPYGYECPSTGLPAPIACQPGWYRGAGANGQAAPLRCQPCSAGTIDLRHVKVPQLAQDYATVLGPEVLKCDSTSSCVLPPGVSLDPAKTSEISQLTRFNWPDNFVNATWRDILEAKYGIYTESANQVAVRIYGHHVNYTVHKYDTTLYPTTAPAWWQPVLLTEPSQCLPCPNGFVCRSLAAHSLSYADTCPSGSYCETITTFDTSTNLTKSTTAKAMCPESVFCYRGATPKTNRQFTCEPGHYCVAGTAAEKRGDFPCRAGYYCPPGTTQADPPDHKCPLMTISPPRSATIDACVDDNRLRETLSTTDLKIPPGLAVSLDARGDIVLKKWQVCKIYYRIAELEKLGIFYGEQLNGVYQFLLHHITEIPAGQQLQRLREYKHDLGRAQTWHERAAVQYRMAILQGPNTTASDGMILDTQPIALPPSLKTNASVVGADTVELSVTAETEELHLRVGLSIMHGRYQHESAVFQNRLNVTTVEPQRSAALPDETFFCVLENDPRLELPLNLDDNAMANVAYANPDNSTNTIHREGVFTNRNAYFADKNVAVLPYMPFFSACKHYDSYVVLYEVLEDQSQCELSPTSDTAFVTPWDIGAHTTGDICDYEIQCVFEEEVDRLQFLPRWYEAPAGSTLFHITRKPTPISMANNPGYFEDNLGTSKLVPVKVFRPSAVANYAIPSRVILDYRYHQVTDKEKHILVATATFEGYRFPCRGFDADGEYFEAQCWENCQVCKDPKTKQVRTDIKPEIDYKLQVRYSPLPYVDLLVLFAFDFSLYVTIFSIIAFLTLLSVMAFWLGHRVFSSKRHGFSVRLNITQYFKLNVLPHYTALALNALIFFPGLAIIWYVFGGLFWASRGTPGDYRLFDDKFAPTVTLDRLTERAFFTGRYAIAHLIFGMFLLFQSAHVLIPHERQSLEEHHAGIKHSWKRSHMILTTVIMMFGLVFLLEFSFSSTFTSYIYLWITILQCVKIFLSEAFVSLLADRLLSDALTLAISLMHYVLLLGARNYFHFLAVFAYQVWLDVLTGIYFMRWFRRYYPAVVLWFKANVFARSRRHIYEAQIDDMDDSVRAHTATYEMLSYLSYVATAELSLLCTPVAYYYLYLFAPELHLYDLYPLPQGSLLLYFIGVLIIVLTMVLSTVFLYNLQELKMRWRIFQYLEYTSMRFKARGNQFRTWNSDDYDQSIDPHLQSTDAMCFSYQYYFILMLYAGSIIVNVLGINMAIRTTYKTKTTTERYNMWADPLAIPFATFLLIILVSCKKGLSAFINWRSELAEDVIAQEQHELNMSMGIGKSFTKCRSVACQADEDDIQDMNARAAKCNGKFLIIEYARSPVPERREANLNWSMGSSVQSLRAAIPPRQTGGAKKEVRKPGQVEKRYSGLKGEHQLALGDSVGPIVSPFQLQQSKMWDVTDRPGSSPSIIEDNEKAVKLATRDQSGLGARPATSGAQPQNAAPIAGPAITRTSDPKEDSHADMHIDQPGLEDSAALELSNHHIDNAVLDSVVKDTTAITEAEADMAARLAMAEAERLEVQTRKEAEEINTLLEALDDMDLGNSSVSREGLGTAPTGAQRPGIDSLKRETAPAARQFLTVGARGTGISGNVRSARADLARQTDSVPTLVLDENIDQPAQSNESLSDLLSMIDEDLMDHPHHDDAWGPSTETKSDASDSV